MVCSPAAVCDVHAAFAAAQHAILATLSAATIGDIVAIDGTQDDRVKRHCRARPRRATLEPVL